MRVKFLRDELYENIGRNKGHQFSEGEQYDFTVDFAEKWIGNEAAELVDGGDGADLAGTSGPFVPVKAAPQPVEQSAPEQKIPSAPVISTTKAGK